MSRRQTRGMVRSGLIVAVALLTLAACGGRETLLTGERIDLRGENPVAVDVSRPIRLPAAEARSEWTHLASGPAHDIFHAALRPEPQLAFSADIGQGDSRRFRITANPVVSGGRIFTVDSRARVMAHSTAGQALWATDLTRPADPGGASGAGLAVAGNRLFVSTGYGDLVALDVASGRRLWTQELGAAAAGAPTVVGDLVYVVARDATAWAVNAADGRVEWTEQGTPSASGVIGGAAPAVSGNMAVLPFASRELAGVLRQGGTRLWTATVAGTRLGQVYASFGDISGDPVIDNGVVYAGSPSGRINAFDLASGEELWSAPEGAMSPVLVTGGSVFAVTDQAELVRLDAETGTRVWGTDLPYFKRASARKRTAVYAHYGPILAGGRLWVASSDGVLRAFSPTNGGLVARIELPGGASTNPIVVDQTLYVVSSDGTLLAFR